jgi:hypothetical protein
VQVRTMSSSSNLFFAVRIYASNNPHCYQIYYLFFAKLCSQSDIEQWLTFVRYLADSAPLSPSLIVCPFLGLRIQISGIT